MGNFYSIKRPYLWNILSYFWLLFHLHFQAFLFSSYILLLPYFFFEFVFFGFWHGCLTTKGVVKIFARCSMESPTLISFNVFVLLWRLLSFSDALFLCPMYHWCIIASNSLSLFIHIWRNSHLLMRVYHLLYNINYRSDRVSIHVFIIYSSVNES